MTSWRNISLVRAQRYAEQFQRLIEDACLSVSIAGEVRRGKGPTSQPLEVVAVPITHQQENLFQESLSDMNVLHTTISGLISARRIEERFEDRRARRQPNEYPKRLLFRADGGMLCPVDLWEATVDTYGAVLALRTGPYGYRSGLVAPLNRVSVSGRAGMLPSGLQLSERWGLVDTEGDVTVSTPAEEHFFERMDVRMVPPEERR